MWNTLLKQYWHVATFKESPAQTPYSTFLLGMTGLFYFILTIFQGKLSGLSKQVPLNLILLMGFVMLVVYAAYTMAILQISGKQNRTVQTLTTLFATNFIIHLVGFPLSVFAPELGAEQNLNMNGLFALSYVLFALVLTIWQFLNHAFIYRQALELGFFSSLFASFGLSIFHFLVLFLIIK